MLYAKLGWNWPSGSGEEVENRKSLQTDGRTDGQTDDGRQVIRKAHLSFQLRWAKNDCIPYGGLFFEVFPIIHQGNYRVPTNGFIVRHTLTKKKFTIVNYTSKLWYYGTLIHNGKLLFYGQNYGTMNKNMVLNRELWNFDLRRKKTVDYHKLRNFDLKWKKFGNTPK